MLLGKRPRPPIRRTTSMTGITVDLPNVDAPEPSDYDNNTPNHQMIQDLHATMVVPEGGSLNYQNNNKNNMNINELYDDHRFLASMVSPRNYHNNMSSSSSSSGGDDFVETAHFLRTCGLCKRRLAPGKDIYMYRGDTAFCSLECREQQMKQDERNEKCNARHASPSTRSSKASSKSQTVSAI